MKAGPKGCICVCSHHQPCRPPGGRSWEGCGCRYISESRRWLKQLLVSHSRFITIVTVPSSFGNLFIQNKMKLLQYYSHDSFENFWKIPFIQSIMLHTGKSPSFHKEKNLSVKLSRQAHICGFAKPNPLCLQLGMERRSSQAQHLSLTVALALQDTCCLSSISQSVFCFAALLNSSLLEEEPSFV